MSRPPYCKHALGARCQNREANNVKCLKCIYSTLNRENNFQLEDEPHES